MFRIFILLLVCLTFGLDRMDRDSRPVAAADYFVPTASDRIPSPAEFDAFAKANNPLECLKASIMRYRNDVQLLHVKLTKQEKLKGRINSPETIDAWYRTEPHSVFMRWETKPAGLADRVLFVEGANDNQNLVHVTSAAIRLLKGDTFSVDPDGDDAKNASRVSTRKAGPFKASQETFAIWQAAEKAGKLKVEYLGLREVPELGNRKLHIFRRTIAEPDAEGIATVEIGLDAETWIQVMSILKDAKGKLIGSYHFKVLEVNPKAPDWLFDKASLMK